MVFRLSEQDGLRGKMKLPFRAVLMNMLEDVQGEAQEIAYGPFEILTVGMRVEDFLAGGRQLQNHVRVGLKRRELWESKASPSSARHPDFRRFPRLGEGDRLAKVKHDYSRDDSRVISVFNSGHFQIFHDTAPALGKGDEIAHIADGGKFYPQGYNIRVVGMKVPVYDPQHPDRNPDCGKAYQRAGVEACPQGKSQTCHRPEPGGGGKAPDLVLAGDQDSAGPQNPMPLMTWAGIRPASEAPVISWIKRPTIMARVEPRHTTR